MTEPQVIETFGYPPIRSSQIADRRFLQYNINVLGVFVPHKLVFEDDRLIEWGTTDEITKPTSETTNSNAHNHGSAATTP